MITTAVIKAKRAGIRTSVGFNIAVVALVGMVCLGAHTGHVHGDVEFTGFSIGGGTEQHAAREQQLAALSAAMPMAAVTPVSAKASSIPTPARKPSVQ
jgi:hypothetical protein